MNAGSTWLVCKTPSLWQAVALLLFAGTIATASIAQDSTYGTLVLQSPVQAVATINGEGAFLLVPGQDLRWSRIRPGSYRVDVRSGGQQWQRDVQVQPGQTETLVAALSSAGTPLSALAPPPPPDMGSGTAPAYVPPPSETPSVMPRSPATRSTVREPRQDFDDRDEERHRQEREDRLEEKRRRDAETRALREAQRREREEQESEEKPRRRRPKVH